MSFAVRKLQYTDIMIFGDDTDLIDLIFYHAERIQMSDNTMLTVIPFQIQDVEYERSHFEDQAEKLA